MKTKPINLWNIALLSLLICTSCNDLNDPTQEGNIIEDSTPTPPMAAKGFFVANEDWFGHDEGTVNYFLKMEIITTSLIVLTAMPTKEKHSVQLPNLVRYGETAFISYPNKVLAWW